MPSSINVSEDAEEVRVIDCGEADADGVYSNGKMVRISEEGILAFGKSEAMKRRSPIGVKVHTSSKLSRFVWERTAVAQRGRRNDNKRMVGENTLTFDDDDLTVNDGNCERAGFHHGLLSVQRGITTGVYKRRGTEVERENHLGKKTRDDSFGAVLAYS